VLWGAVHLLSNFAALAAFVRSGPMTEEERRRLQLTENLAREDLRPGELAAALLLWLAAARGAPYQHAPVATRGPLSSPRQACRLRPTCTGTGWRICAAWPNGSERLNQRRSR
jgi:hypothetical protein